ncbi:MAG: hypothetical protein AAFY41_11390 [Bacteroidota bacterium]
MLYSKIDQALLKKGNMNINLSAYYTPLEGRKHTKSPERPHSYACKNPTTNLTTAHQKRLDRRLKINPKQSQLTTIFNNSNDNSPLEVNKMEFIRLMKKTPIVDTYVQSLEEATEIGDYKEGTLFVKTEGSPGSAPTPTGSGVVAVGLLTANVNDDGRYLPLDLNQSDTSTSSATLNVSSHSGLLSAAIGRSGDPVGRYLRVLLIPILPDKGYVNVEVTFQPKRS